ncbi:MAG TPA: hypothetical protein VIV14_09775 [Gammaproteobacteria bacterium]
MSTTHDAAGRRPLPDRSGSSDDIIVIPRYDDSIPSSNCLVVAPFRKAERTPTIMANIEHYQRNADPVGFPWSIQPVTEEPVLLQDAMEIAMAYARANRVPAIFVNQDGFSSDSEKRQTDTQPLRTGAPRAR